jgi:dihydroorotate dehydrogenase (NAD+) catalytic subunit
MSDRAVIPGPGYAAPDLTVRLGPLTLAHPLVNASGTMELFELAETFGETILEEPPVAAYVPKTITPQPRAGNMPPRILETPCGMLNAVGLPGEGLSTFSEERLPKLLALPCPVIISIGGFSPADYVESARALRAALDRLGGGGWPSRAGLELNISCPNVHSGCLLIGSDPSETETVVSGVRSEWPGLLVAKLTPNVTDISAVAKAAQSGGADAIAAVNTYKGMAIDKKTLRPYLGNVSGGLSGAAIKPLALRAVFEIFARVELPIIGMGGVGCLQDVLDFMSCGASLVAVGSAGFRDPWLPSRLAAGLGQELAVRDLSLGQLVGVAHRP